MDKTIIFNDTDGDGKISYEEFCAVSNFHFFRFVFSYQLAGDVVEKLEFVKI